MAKKELLIIYNIFGIRYNENIQIDEYKRALTSLFWHLDQYSNREQVRVVLGACLVSDKCVATLLEAFPGRLQAFSFPDRYTCQIVTNKIAFECEKRYNEEYRGYFYISSGLYFPQIENWKLFDRIENHLNEASKTGILQLQVNNDNGYHFFGPWPV